MDLIEIEEYAWSVFSLTKRTIGNHENVITKVIWKKVGYDKDGVKGEFIMATMFDKLDESNFIKYEDLTQDIIVDWIKQSMDEESIDKEIIKHIQRNRDQEMEVDFEDMPWNIETNVDTQLSIDGLTT